MASLLTDADPDAVFVANNLMTVGALECLIQHDVQVPREIGMVGFEEIPWAPWFARRCPRSRNRPMRWARPQVNC